MSGEVLQSFDMHAAWLRKAGVDVSAFLGALAARFESALPRQVEVQRRRAGLFSREKHVERMILRTDAANYEIYLDGANTLRCTRASVVGGVTLNTEKLDARKWLAALEADLAALADHMGTGQSVLHDFLTS